MTKPTMTRLTAIALNAAFAAALAASPALAQTGTGGTTAAGSLKDNGASGGSEASSTTPKTGDAMMPKKSGGMSGAAHKMDGMEKMDKK